MLDHWSFPIPDSIDVDVPVTVTFDFTTTPPTCEYDDGTIIEVVTGQPYRLADELNLVRGIPRV